MFCKNCGSKLIDNSEFCSNCGAKISNYSNDYEPKEVEVLPLNSNVNADKKRKNLIVVIGSIVGFIFLCIILIFFYINYKSIKTDKVEIIDKTLEKTDEVIKKEDNIDLTAIYNNEEYSVYFKYPSTWKPVSEKEYSQILDEKPIICLFNEDNYKTIGVQVINVPLTTKEFYDVFYSEDDEFIKKFKERLDNNIIVKDIFTTQIDGLPARKITYIDEDGIEGQSYFYSYNLISVNRIDFVYMSIQSNLQVIVDEIISSYKITIDEQEKDIIRNYIKNMEKETYKFFSEKDYTLEGNYTDYLRWCGEYEGGWINTWLHFSLYSDGTQDPGCGNIIEHFRGMEFKGKVYYLGENKFLWEREQNDSIEKYYIKAILVEGNYQLEIYNSDGEYEVTFNQSEWIQS
ncbi:MAG: PsbP-related protein [Peptoanaerobacter stomatis]|uniref:PsbP-related protein n=1 Tax=Peptoanaerobacter stomatis TaxID=796937 RepID=UPI003F9FFF2B